MDSPGALVREKPSIRTMIFRNLWFLCSLVLIVFLISPPAAAQRGGRGQPPATARQAAALDVTGYWVSVIMEDWKFRMVTPKKGVYDTLTLNAEGRRIGDTWDPARDEAAGEQCKAYGAPNIMRLPGRLHITWQDDNTLRVDTDAGTQTRLLRFGKAPLPGTEPRKEPQWQGESSAQWDFAGGARGRAAPGQKRAGMLTVVTTPMP